jgi:flagellar basal-body rod protein FlgB
MRIITIIFMMLPFFSQASELDSFYDQMKFLSQRDRIISENIANADTPKYQPKELKKKGKNGADVSMSRTHPSHMDVDANPVDFELTKAEVLEIKPNGNSVTLENELMKKSENAMRLMESTNLYNKSRGMLKTAVIGNK